METFFQPEPWLWLVVSVLFIAAMVIARNWT
jgi:hypothetical protein